MVYVTPSQVISPQDRWELISVLCDGGSGGFSIAYGTWDGDQCFAVRWSGTSDVGSELGLPQSRGYATWFMLPEAPHGSIVAYLLNLQATADSGVDARALLETIQEMLGDSGVPDA